MPFQKWAVEPVFLCRKPLPPDKKNTHEFYSMTNCSLVNCLKQLSSVAQIADRIFDEIGSECRLVAERAERLKVKIDSCQEAVSQLDARAVTVPVSDLSKTAKYLRRNKPFTTQYEQSSQFFLPSTRPPCVDKLYGAACATPVGVICTIDKYRTDGLNSSQLFMVTPVLGGTRKKRRKLLDIETRKPANFTLARELQDIKYDESSSRTLVSPSTGFTLKQNENLELERLPSPEEQAMLVSLEYPSTVVPVDTSGSTFTRMSLLRRSLIHVDFIIKRKKNKKKSKRRHTFCEGDGRELDKAARNVTHTSCQTDDICSSVMSSSATIHRSLSKRRSRSTLDNSRRKTDIFDDLELGSLQRESKDSATEEEKEKSPSKVSLGSIKKSRTIASLKSRAYNFNPISSISAAISIAAVKMRHSSRGTGKHDDGRSSSGNWSASSSTRASVDSDHQHPVTPVDGISSPSRNSVGKDSLLSDGTQQDQHNRSKDNITVQEQSFPNSPTKQTKYAPINPPWSHDTNGRISSTPTPEYGSHCSSSTPVVRSPYAGRRGVSDDGDSSVYSVDTDGYYTSMHTDSGLWSNTVGTLKPEDIHTNLGFRHRQESQSSVSTIGNSSINSFLSKSATECSSNNGSLKKQACPQPPPRVSSCKVVRIPDKDSVSKKEQVSEESDKSESPQPLTGSASESEHEVTDRIRVKTAITANRYPSMCAVSPETSDEEIGEWKTKLNSPNVNVVVAEVHREEKAAEDVKTRRDDNQLRKDIDNVRLKASSINMYRSETPVQSTFSSRIPQVTTSTPRSDVAISTFAPDLQDLSDGTLKPENKNFIDDCDDLIVTDKPVSPLSFQAAINKSLIPLKYAQRITVTPIARTDTSSSPMGTIKRSPKQFPLNSPSPNESETFPALSQTTKSYVAFKAPDSPVSSVKTLIKPKVVNSSPNNSLPRSVASPNNSLPRSVSSPNNSLPRSVARVTLDPSGKVVYSSNSLGRANNASPNTNAAICYATLPMYQSQTSETVAKHEQYKKPDNETTSAYISADNTVQDLSTACPTVTMATSYIPQHKQNSAPYKYTSMNRDFNFRPSRGGRFCRSYFPSHLISPPSTPNSNDKPSKSQVYAYQTPRDQNFRPLSNTDESYHPSVTQASKIPSSCSNQLNRNNQSPNSFSAVPNSSTHSIPQTLTHSVNSDTYWPSRRMHSLPTNYNSHLPSSIRSSSHPTTFGGKLSCTNGNVPHSQKFQSRPASFSTVPTTSEVPSIAKNSSIHSYSSQFTSQVPASNRLSNNLKTPYSQQKFEVPASGKIENRRIERMCLQPKIPTQLPNTHTSINNRTSFVNLRPPDLIPSGESPPSTLDITSPALIHSKSNKNKAVVDSNNSSMYESPQKNLKALSTNELFAIIHSSKKKHNIKTESEKSMSPLSSRSNSPALSQCSLPAKLQPVETGVLGKRGFVDRTQWYNSIPSNLGKKHSAPDKLGLTKPTSMHDFKMLLLQTRSGNNESSSRPSAAELLKVSPPKHSPGHSSKLPVPSPAFKTIPYLSQNSGYSPTHGTMPIKRNIRTRSPYLTRYDSAYPPIMEDCSEETESYYEDSSLANSRQSYTPKKEMNLRSGAPGSKATSTWV